MMRFLIVDDDPQKVSQLRVALSINGIRDDAITVAECLASARRALHESAFDAMLLDVVLPVRGGGRPSWENSHELLREIISDGMAFAPRYIVAVTAELEALNRFAPLFRQLTINVVTVSPGDDDWKGFIANLVAFMRRVDEAKGAHDVDICILSALRSPELDAVLATWPVRVGAERPLNGSVLVREGTCELNSGLYRFACAHPVQMGPVAACHAATALLQSLRPKVLVMSGICGGFSKEVRIGDVVVAERSWDWQAGKWDEYGSLLAAPDHREASAQLVSSARTIDPDTLTRFGREISGAKPGSSPRLVVGPMVTGSSVVASADIQKVFRGQHRKMVAIDMECYGVYYATSVSDGPKAEVICIKAVSDLADREKADDFQRYCSHLSALVALETTERFFRRRVAAPEEATRC